MNENDILALIRGNATIPYRIYIEGNETPLTEDDIISTTYEDYRYVDSNSLVIGQFVARKLNGELKNTNRDLFIENKEIEVQMGVRVGDTTTWYSLGNFLITKPKEDDVKDKMTFESMDYAKKFNKVFNPSSITFPCTARELAQNVCGQCGVQLGTNNFANADFIVENNQYTEKDSCRKIMQDIGKLAYSWVRIGWDNKCYIDFEVKTNVESHNIITNDNYYDFSKQQKVFGPVNRVVVGMKDVDGENVSIQDDDSIATHGLHTLYIYDNNLTYTPELRQQVISSAERLYGLIYTPIDINTTGHPWLIGNEVVRIVDMEGNNIDTYPFDRTIEYMGHIKSKIVAKADTQVQQEYVNNINNGFNKALNDTMIIVDKNKKEIQALSQQLNTTTGVLESVELTINSQAAKIDILGKNIDPITGEVTSVKTGKGYEFNNNGLLVSDVNEPFNTQITNKSMQHRDGDTIITETSVEGFMTTNLKEKGTHQYSYNNYTDSYDMVAERIEVDGEGAYAHFYNGGDL